MRRPALRRLMQLPPARRREQISAGLHGVADNVATLDADIALLTREGRGRSLWILARHAEEEAAKALILLDLARMDPNDQAALTRHLANFHDHLARCIYAEVTQMSPADFAEVRRMVDSMRPSYLLDGPEGFEWIFPNRLLAGREEGLYVDYVADDDGERWVTPAANDTVEFGGPSPAVRELVASLRRLGAMSVRGLEILAGVWAGVELTGDTHWQEVVALNRKVTELLIAADLAAQDADGEDVRRVVRRWGFPLSGLELSMVKVPRADLEAERERLAAAFA